MADERDALQQAFHAIAHEDAVDAERGAARVGALLAAEVRALRPLRPHGWASRAAGWAMAAGLVAGVAVSAWIVVRGIRPPEPASQSAGRGSAAEIATAFMPLAYNTVPYTDAQVVRLEVPRAALAEFGLAPPDAIDGARSETVVADVLVGEDGLARAVRFVRAPRAPGVLP